MEVIRNPQLSIVWLKAAVIGSLWASVEIVVGSFLHNLQIPFTGTILSFFAIFLLTSFSVMWKEPGIIWRAGVICAIMKSISPSAVIIGPMIGISTEALFFEWMIWLSGRNFFGYLLAGAIAVFSALVHKLLSLLLLYGTDFVKILEDFYFFSVKQLKINDMTSFSLILFISLIYLSVGFIAAAIGYRTARHFLKHEKLQITSLQLGLGTNSSLFNLTVNQPYSVLLMILHVTIMIGILILISFDHLKTAIMLSFLYVTLVSLRYPNVFRKLQKVSVWLQFLILFMLAYLLWDSVQTNSNVLEKGWEIGLMMILRAVILIVGFTAISIELKNPLIKSVLYKKGLSNLYLSLNLSFSALPGLVSQLSDSKKIIFSPAETVIRFLASASQMVNLFEEKQRNLPKVFVITGEVESGKTSFVNDLIRQLQESEINIGGFLSEAIVEEGQKNGFTLQEVSGKRSSLLCTKSLHEGWLLVGRYYMNPLAMILGNKILSEIDVNKTKLIVVDELGPLEIQNKGWAESVGNLCNTTNISQLWVVRKSLVKQMIRKWSLSDVYIFDVEKDTVKDVSHAIKDEIRV